MKITIDKQEIEVTNPELNLIEIAKQNDIAIPSPCYNHNQKFGCCNACAIEIDGEIKYACCTKPVEGMKIIFKRDDLAELRKQRMLEYKKNIKKNVKMPCFGGECSCKSNCC